MLKKIILSVIFLSTIMLVAACQDEPDKNPIDQAYDALSIGFQGADSIEGIKEDITLPTTIEDIEGITVTWTSESEDIISVSGKVFRTNEDVTLVLTAHIVLGTEERYKFFEVTVLRLEDSRGPIIYGAKDFYVDEGASEIDYLLGVYAIDDMDGAVEVIVDASKVNVNVPGVYEVIYTAKDSAGNETTVTIDVTVETKPLETISAVKLKNNGTNVKTRGNITAYYKTDTNVIVYLEDDISSIKIIAPLEFETYLDLYKRFEVRGTKNVLNQRIVIDNVKDIRLISEDSLTPNLVASNKLSSYNEKLVQVYGLVHEIHTTVHTTYNLLSLTGHLKLVIPSDMETSLKTDIQSKLRTSNLGLGVHITGVVEKQGSDYVVLLTNPDQVTFETNIDIQEVTTIIHTVVDIPSFEGYITTNLDFLTNNDLPFGSTITYTSSNETVLSNQGQVTRLEDDTAVTLSYVIEFNGVVIKEATFNLVISGTSAIYTGYYATLAGKTGGLLQTELTKIISNYRYRSYDAARDILQISDRDPNNSNNIILIYNRASVRSTWDGGKTWNREHVWPQSFLSNSHEKADLHNLKPANEGINSSRGNLSFKDAVQSSYGKVTGGWFPGDEDKGDVARILFYMVTRYKHLNIGTMGILSELIKWHIEDPVDDFERNRNEVIYEYQENRNPFIDHPDLVHQLWSA